MSGLEIYEQIKFWLPMVTVFSLVIKAYFAASNRVSTWAETLLDNHLSHIQAAAEKATVTLEVVEKNTAAMASEMKAIRTDQAAILTGVEVLKAKV